MKERRTKPRHNLFRFLVYLPTTIYLRCKIGFRKQKRYKLPKNGAIVLCNHQTDFDPLMLSSMFNRPIYYVCTDSVFSNKRLANFLDYCFAVIPKKKGAVDSSCVRSILQTIKENGCVGIFPEGNRTMAEFQFEIDPAIAKLVKKSKVDLVLCNIHGGTAVFPRFAKKARKGRITANVKRVIKPSEYENMSDEELTKIICDELRVFDSIDGVKIKSNASAEYLERILFVCPKCGHMQTIYTVDDHVCCSKCDLDVIYDETSHFVSSDPEFKFKLLVDWYDYQKKYLLDLNLNEKTLFEDKDITLYSSEVRVERKVLSSGMIRLTKDNLEFSDLSIPLKDIEIASVISGNQFNFTADGKNYLVKGHPRFNALKYVLAFIKLDTKMHQNKADHFFGLE